MNKMIMNPQLYHYLQIVYHSEEERNIRYGRELAFIPVVGSAEQGFVVAAREPSIYVKYRAKGVQYTGKRSLFSNETNPTIELLLQVPSDTPLEAIVQLDSVNVAQKRQVTTAELTFEVATSYFSGGQSKLSRLRTLLDGQKTENFSLFELSAVAPSDHLLNTFSDSTYEHELTGLAKGQIPEVLRMYDVMQKTRMNYRSIAITFS